MSANPTVTTDLDMAGLIAESVRRAPDQVAIGVADGSRRLTYRQLAQLARSLAFHLASAALPAPTRSPSTATTGPSSWSPCSRRGRPAPPSPDRPAAGGGRGTRAPGGGRCLGRAHAGGAAPQVPD